MSDQRPPRASTDQPPRRAKHLIDPTVPRTPPNAEDVERLERVQRWVLSILVATTIGHLSAGLVIFAVALDRDQELARIGLCVLAGGFGVVALASAFAFHRRSMASPWLVLGFLPTAIGLFFVL